jgi:hypothetical protein
LAHLALSELAPAQITLLNRVWLVTLGLYRVIAGGLVLARIGQLVMSGH